MNNHFESQVYFYAPYPEQPGVGIWENNLTRGAAGRALGESVASQLPGRKNGPADAYRHVLLAAELTRLFGESYARDILNAHEFPPKLPWQSGYSDRNMDLHNNEVGIDIGERIREQGGSWRDVVEASRAAIMEGQELEDNGKGGAPGKVGWLPEDKWENNPVDEDTGERIPTDDPRVQWPNPQWPNGLPPYPRVITIKDIVDFLDEGYEEFERWFRDKKENWEETFNDLWDRAKNWLRRSDPLVLDLDGDGIELVAADGTVLFDHDGNRVAEATGWVAPDDGFLVIDKNGNGQIDDGSELFGDGNPDAFHDPEVQNTLSAGIRALRRYDSNQDGLFDAADEAYGQVRVWRDLNQDGVSQANELFTLADVGIQSIHLNPVSTADADVGHGNVADSTGQFTRTDGSQGNFYDMLLANNPFYRQFKDEVELTETARSLLDIRGSGAVRDLREAASLDETLAAMVTGLAPGISRGDMLTQVDNILRRWANTSHMQDTETWLRETQGLNGSFRVVSNGTDRTDLTVMLSVLERFNGGRFFADRGDGYLWAGNRAFSPVVKQVNGEIIRSFDIALPPGSVSLLQQSYAALKNAVYGRLVRDARLADYINDGA